MQVEGLTSFKCQTLAPRANSPEESKSPITQSTNHSKTPLASLHAYSNVSFRGIESEEAVQKIVDGIDRIQNLSYIEKQDHDSFSFELDGNKYRLHYPRGINKPVRLKIDGDTKKTYLIMDNKELNLARKLLTKLETEIPIEFGNTEEFLDSLLEKTASDEITWHEVDDPELAKLPEEGLKTVMQTKLPDNTEVTLIRGEDKPSYIAVKKPSGSLIIQNITKLDGTGTFIPEDAFANFLEAVGLRSKNSILKLINLVLNQ